MTPPLDQHRYDDPAPDGALACALAAMRRDGEALPLWTDALARRDHSSPSATARDFLRAPRAMALIGRRSLGLAPAETAVTAAARAALSYWARIGDGRPPARRACAPAVDRPLLTPWLFIGVCDGADLTIQLSGEAVDDFAGRPLGGARLSGLAADSAEADAFASALRMARATSGPTLVRGDATYAGDRRQRYEIALAPMRDDDDAAPLALGALGLDVLRDD